MPTKTGSRERMYGWHTQAKPRNEAKQEWRGRLSEFYNTRRWKALSKAFKIDHPLCEECKRNGMIKPSQITDHIIPYPIKDFWNRDNWQALCKSCNNAKGERDKKILNEYKL